MQTKIPKFFLPMDNCIYSPGGKYTVCERNFRKLDRHKQIGKYLIQYKLFNYIYMAKFQ